jgi:DNA-binding phage protein
METNVIVTDNVLTPDFIVAALQATKEPEQVVEFLEAFLETENNSDLMNKAVVKSILDIVQSRTDDIAQSSTDTDIRTNGLKAIAKGGSIFLDTGMADELLLIAGLKSYRDEVPARYALKAIAGIQKGVLNKDFVGRLINATVSSSNWYILNEALKTIGAVGPGLVDRDMVIEVLDRLFMPEMPLDTEKAILKTVALISNGIADKELVNEIKRIEASEDYLMLKETAQDTLCTIYKNQPELDPAKSALAQVTRALLARNRATPK